MAGITQRGVRHQNDKLLPPGTGDNVGFASPCFDQVGHRAQHLVAGKVAPGIVDAFEEINVQGE